MIEIFGILITGLPEQVQDSGIDETIQGTSPLTMTRKLDDVRVFYCRRNWVYCTQQTHEQGPIEGITMKYT